MGLEMLRTQAEELNAAGLEMIMKAKMCQKSSDAKIFSDLGLALLTESRTIWDSIKCNSVLVYVECRLKDKSRIGYSDYLDFCVRNKLDSFKEIDFELTCKKLMED